MSLRSNLILLVLAVLVPVAIFCGAVAFILVEHERDTFRRGAEARALALMTAVDSEIDSSLTTVNALAVMPSLADGNLAYFKRTAANVLVTQPDWLRIRLISRDGEKLVDVALAGDITPTRNLSDVIEPVVRTGKPHVGNVGLDRRMERWGYRVLSPVMQDGAVKYVVSAFVSVDSMRHIVEAQELPAGWGAVIVDRGNRFVSRSSESERYVGQLASENLREALARKPSGWFEGKTLDGRSVFSPYWRSDKSGWAVSTSYPIDEVEGSARRAAWILGAGLIVSLAIALALAAYIARHISAPIATLAGVSDAMALGRKPEIVDESDIVEVRKLTNAVRAAARAIGERQALVERERAALTISERRFRAMADGAPVMIWMSGTDKLCTWFNKVWLDFTGRAMEQELGNGWTGSVHPEDLGGCEDTYSAAFDRREPFAKEYRLRRRDGEYRWMLDQGVARYESDGAFAGYVGSCVDIHERKRAEQELLAADRHKDEFLAALSHELRNPLAALTTAAHILKAAPPGTEASMEAARIVARQTRQMSRLIEDLLDISRITTGKMVLERRDLDFAALVHEVVASWQKAGRADNVSISTGLEPVWVNGDRARLEQVVANLLDNAVKFTSLRRRIDLTVRRNGRDALLEIADEGQGMPAELIERAFGLFVQGPDDLAHSQGGLGIGLALVQRIVELHQGSVSASSEGHGKGSTFRVWLPAVEPPPEIRAQRAHAAPPAAIAPRRILLVEDNDDVRETAHAALTLGGHRVTEARDGASGLAVAAAVRPDVAIVDLGLPGLDGFEVARQLRAMHGARIRLIALSGYGQPDDVRRALAAGFDIHLTKPVSPERLLESLAQLPEVPASA